MAEQTGGWHFYLVGRAGEEASSHHMNGGIRLENTFENTARESNTSLASSLLYLCHTWCTDVRKYPVHLGAVT